ncbi:MAG: hypothetical protein AAB870_02500 [Patescibacteria group bacterium]
MKRLPIKSERREVERRKKTAVTGGSFSAQFKRALVNKGYQGLAKGVKKRIIAKIKAI